MKDDKVKKVNVWAEFKEWLYNSNTKLELSDEIIKGINPRSVLSMFGNHGDLTIELNRVFNNYYTMGLNHREFYKFIKELVYKRRISKYSFSFFKGSLNDKSNKEKLNIFPDLKIYEINYLLTKLEDDPDAECIFESLGLSKPPKLKKVTKKELKELNNSKKSDKKVDDISVIIADTLKTNRSIINFKSLTDLRRYIHE